MKLDIRGNQYTWRLDQNAKKTWYGLQVINFCQLISMVLNIVFFLFCFCSAYYRSLFVYPSIKYWVLKDTNSTQHYIYEQYVSKCKGETSLVLLILFLQTFRARWQQWLYSVGENQWDALMSIYRPRL